MAKSVDAMWRAAGDTATDYNHYTKRATLFAVYASTIAVFLNDESEDHADTRAFLARRIEMPCPCTDRVGNHGTHAADREQWKIQVSWRQCQSARASACVRASLSANQAVATGSPQA